MIEPASASPARLDHLRDWLAEHGARARDLRIARGPGGQRHVRATAAIVAGATVLSIPRALLMTCERAAASPLGRQLAEAGVELTNPHSLLAAWLAVERCDGHSFWRPYLDSLPAAFPSHPLCWSRGEIGQLEGTLAMARLERQRDSILRDFVALRTRVPLCAGLTLNSYGWARLCVGSRVFRLDIDGRSTFSLVPLADLLNHRRTRETRWAFAGASDAFEMTASRDFAAGAAVHDSYGHKANSRLLVHYGFCLERNPDDEVGLLIAGRPFRASARLDRDGDAPLVAFLRAVPNPRRRLRRAVEEALARFPTSLAEDEELLLDPGLSSNARNAVLVRRGEKRVLAALARMARRGDLDARASR